MICTRLFAMAICVACIAPGLRASDDVLVGVPGAVRSLAGSIVLPQAVRATWIDDRRILFATEGHVLVLYDSTTRRTTTLPVPAPASKFKADWHWRVSPDARWVFVQRTEQASSRYTHGPPPDLLAQMQKLNWSGFVDLDTPKAIPYEGFAVGWQTRRALIALSQSGGPLLLVDPRDPARARWLFDEAGAIEAVSADGRVAFAFDGRDGRVGYSLLDLIDATQRSVSFGDRCARRAALSNDGRWLVTVTFECAATSDIAEVRSVADGRVMFRAPVAKLATTTALVTLGGTPPRFVLASSSAGKSRLVVLSLGKVLDVEDVAVPAVATLGQIVRVADTPAVYWISERGDVVRFDVTRGNSAQISKSDPGASFVASRDPTWPYFSHSTFRSAYGAYWPSLTARARQHVPCDSAAVCLTKGTALIVGTRGHADRQLGTDMLETACNLHDRDGCYALAQALEQGGTSRMSNNIRELRRKACLMGEARACDATAVPAREAGGSAGPAVIEIAMGCQSVCALLNDHTVACHQGPAPPPGKFESIAAGGTHACGLRQGGAAVCWGAGGAPPTNDPTTSEFGQSRPPPDRFSMLTAGDRHTCGLLRNGAVRCWGSNEHGQSTPPPGMRFRTLSAGQWHTCGVREDDHVACWGADTSGQADPPSDKFRSVSAGSTHTCGITLDGEVRCWGSNRRHNGTVDGKAEPPQGLFVRIVAGNTHSCAFKADGSVVCWGASDDGQLQVPAGRFVRIDRGCQSACALDERGQVQCWGGKSAPFTLWPR